jgi:restriction system protein
MITTRRPETWSDLQEVVASVLRECGLTVEIEKPIATARGEVVVDVFAEESVRGRRHVILCECKHWRSRVPKSVVHSFRSVVGDSGANTGYIISSSGFQSGAASAAAMTNTRLVTWEAFQAEFEASWVENHLYPLVADHFDELLMLTEPLLPREFNRLTADEKQQFLDLKRQYDDFGVIMLAFTPYARMIRSSSAPRLPLREALLKAGVERSWPADLLDAKGYREFLQAAEGFSASIVAKFRAVLPKVE